MNIWELAENEIRAFGEHVAVMFEGQEFTNVELDRTERKLGNALKDLGVKRGDRVIIQMPNCPEVGESFGAVWRIGAVVVPMNYLIGDEESAHIYQDSGAETVISSSQFLPKIEACRAKVPAIKNVLLIDKEVPKGYHSFWELVEGSSDEQEMVKTHDDELAALVYTSGTTGRPKGVMHSHYSLYASAKVVSDSVVVLERRVSVFILPLCHTYGILCMNIGKLQGGWNSVILPSFSVEKVFEAIGKYKATHFAGVPTLYVLMLLYPEHEKYDLSSIQQWKSGSAPLSMETWQGFKEKFGAEILEGWGLTESGSTGCTMPPKGPIKVGSIGKPMIDTEVKIVDNEGRELPQGKEGELIISGPGLMKGYWNIPEETAESLRNGWLYTGDIGYVDKDGYFFITDRKKDLIIKGGENISPRQIEEVLFAHPRVAEAAVVGIKDNIYGEDIKAFVVIKQGEEATAEEITDYCRSRLKTFKTPKELQFVESLPKNLVGKVERKELRKLG
jgi:long-chain acyl-CoA synthetase